ncbi:hypothetical protein F1728_06485 [Gimesia benthica]|uniref:Uncharacterized protein n=1 Tax=Gimesia benthica TaxID=2608982 RepID=A0A6I6A8Q8_9PLAN|nr:hypothetical protein [Gimesia benthica]QGQ22340.1 hypothetical protein F1728_06485 [Gimesia benthica]
MKDLLDIDSQPREEVAWWTCHKWNHTATEVAADALKDLLSDHPEITAELLQPIIENSDFWLKQIAQTVLEIEPEDDCEFKGLLECFQNAVDGECPPCLFEGLDLLWDRANKGLNIKSVVIEPEEGNIIELDSEKLIEAGILYGGKHELPDPHKYLLLSEGDSYADLAWLIKSQFFPIDECQSLSFSFELSDIASRYNISEEQAAELLSKSTEDVSEAMLSAGWNTLDKTASQMGYDKTEEL